MTKHMINFMPRILKKYSTDEKKCTLLLSLISSLDVDIFSTTRAGPQLEELFENVRHVMSLSQNSDLLRAGAKSLEHLSEKGSNVDEQARTFLSQIIDKFVSELDDALNNFIGSPEDSTEYSLGGAFKRISMIILYNDCSGRDLFKRSYSILKNAPGSVSEELLVSAELVCYHEIIWMLHRAFDSETEREAIDEIGRMRDDYLDLVASFINSCATHPKVGARCFTSVCDLLIYFNSSLTDKYPHLQMLVMSSIAEDLRQSLLKYFQSNVLPFDDSSDYDRNESEAQNEDRMLEVLDHRRRMTGYMKLILTGMIPLRDSALILQFYTRTKCYADIFKWFVTKLREVNKERCCEQMFNTLVRLYENYLYTCGWRAGEHPDDQPIPVSRDSSDFKDMKDMARRFVMLFGIDSCKMAPVTNAFNQ